MSEPSVDRISHRRSAVPGSAHGRFNRFVQQRNLPQAEMAAREMGRLSLADALSLVALYAGTAVDACHLVQGARLFPDPGVIGKLAGRLKWPGLQ